MVKLADVIDRNEAEQHVGEVLLMMLEVALVEGKGSILRRLNSGDEILDGGLFIYLFIFSEERGAEMRVDENASSVYVQCLFQFNLKFLYCSDLTLENTT
jgi:hypothetical protein